MNSSIIKSISYSYLNHISRKILDTEMLAALMPLMQPNKKHVQCWKCHFHKKSVSQETTWIGIALFTKTPWLQGNEQFVLKHISQYTSGIIKEVYKPMESTWSWFLMADLKLKVKTATMKAYHFGDKNRWNLVVYQRTDPKQQANLFTLAFIEKNICWVRSICKTLFWIQTVPCQ